MQVNTISNFNPKDLHINYTLFEQDNINPEIPIQQILEIFTLMQETFGSFQNISFTSRLCRGDIDTGFPKNESIKFLTSYGDEQIEDLLLIESALKITLCKFLTFHSKGEFNYQVLKTGLKEIRKLYDTFSKATIHLRTFRRSIAKQSNYFKSPKQDVNFRKIGTFEKRIKKVLQDTIKASNELKKTYKYQQKKWVDFNQPGPNGPGVIITLPPELWPKIFEFIFYEPSDYYQQYLTLSLVSKKIKNTHLLLDPKINELVLKINSRPLKEVFRCEYHALNYLSNYGEQIRSLQVSSSWNDIPHSSWNISNCDTKYHESKDLENYLKNCNNLFNLSIQKMPITTCAWSLILQYENLNTLKINSINGCSSFDFLFVPPLNLPNLKMLSICGKFSNFSFLDPLKNLKILGLFGEIQLNLLDISNLQQLESLCVFSKGYQDVVYLKGDSDGKFSTLLEFNPPVMPAVEMLSNLQKVFIMSFNSFDEHKLNELLFARALKKGSNDEELTDMAKKAIIDQTGQEVLRFMKSFDPLILE